MLEWVIGLNHLSGGCDTNHPNESKLNIFQSIIELDELYSFYEQNETKELVQIVARALFGCSRSKWVKNTPTIHILNDASFMKAIKKMWEQVLEANALEEQIEWMKKATFPNTDPEEAIEGPQEINDNLEFFESGASKFSERELIKDIIAKNLWGEIKTEFIQNKGHQFIDLDEAIKIIQD